jgi:toxin-antitoxin system PIN domain toxin
MRALLDVNVLVALFDPDHVFHAVATAWWRDNEMSGWASTPITENGVVRTLSRRSYTNPVRLADAISILRQWTTPPHHMFWPDDLSILDDSAIDQQRLYGPGQTTDVYLLALAVRHRARLVTLDKAITRNAVRGAAPEHLVLVT